MARRPQRAGDGDVRGQKMTAENPPEEPQLDGEPILEFQPAVDLSTGLLLGFEALVRWRNHEGGLIMPDVLLPWAVHNDYMAVLGDWVLEEACSQAADWPSGIQLAVNVSAWELRSRRSSLATSNALESSGLNPDRLTIEVTESSVSDAQAREDLRALRGLGVNIAVDDVGTSWSTIENFRMLHVETAKIDREFISGLEPVEGVNRLIVHAIVSMARSMAISTVAEGIETPEQVAILRQLGADVGQGFFFARPVPSGEAHALANTEPRLIYPLLESSPDDTTDNPQLETGKARVLR